MRGIPLLTRRDSYTMIFVFPILFVSWKLLQKTKWKTPLEVDLYTGVAEIEEYTANYVPRPPRNKAEAWGMGSRGF